MDKDLTEFIRTKSQPAFESVVQRHVGAVHGQALRKLRDHDAARDVTQAVFVLLAQRAHTISDKVILGGWLHNVTRYACLNHQRAQSRRQKHEQQAAHMRPEIRTDNTTENPAAWDEAAPQLDDAIAQLRSADRDALMLRYFQNQSIRDIAASLNVSEDAAKQRVSRAVERLRKIFARRGVVAPAVVVGTWLNQAASHAAPVDVMNGALQAANAAPVSAIGMAKGTAKLMAVAKAKLTVGVLVIVAAVGGVTGAALRSGGNREMPPAQQPSIAVAAADEAEVVVDPELLGHWELAVPGDLKVEITESTYTHRSRDEEAIFDITAWDPDAEPKSMDLVMRSGTLRGQPSAHLGKTMLISYELKDGLLLMVAGQPGMQRPPRVEGAPGTKMFPLKRKAVDSPDARSDASSPAALLRKLDAAFRAADERAVMDCFLFTEPVEDDPFYLMLKLNLAQIRLFQAFDAKFPNQQRSFALWRPAMDQVLRTALMMMPSDDAAVSPELSELKVRPTAEALAALMRMVPPQHPAAKWLRAEHVFRKIDGRWKWDVRDRVQILVYDRPGHVADDSSKAPEELSFRNTGLFDAMVGIADRAREQIEAGQVDPAAVGPALEQEIEQAAQRFGLVGVSIEPIETP